MAEPAKFFGQSSKATSKIATSKASSGNKSSNSNKESTSTKSSKKELKRLQSLEDSSENDSTSCSNDEEPLSGKQKSLRSIDLSGVEAFDESSNSLNQEESHVNTSDDNVNEDDEHTNNRSPLNNTSPTSSNNGNGTSNTTPLSKASTPKPNLNIFEKLLAQNTEILTRLRNLENENQQLQEQLQTMKKKKPEKLTVPNDVRWYVKKGYASRKKAVSLQLKDWDSSPGHQ
ncbi:uncharacterized protein [Clytia hemisphaerica]|uniref:uncharacterized protein n=1 Tax=Clytia hemisphaerica TaxID=252671 RepID=UPI0034D3AE8E